MDQQSTAGTQTLTHRRPKGEHVKTYQGWREGAAVLVTVNHGPLNPRLDLYNHSPTGFEWGYAGSGPAQLALAIVADHLRNDDEAFNLYQEFKRGVVARLPYPGWTLTSAQVAETLETLSHPALREDVSPKEDVRCPGFDSRSVDWPRQFMRGQCRRTIPAAGRLGRRDGSFLHGAHPHRLPVEMGAQSRAAKLFQQVVAALKLLLEDRDRSKPALSQAQIGRYRRVLTEAEGLRLEDFGL